MACVNCGETGVGGSRPHTCDLPAATSTPVPPRGPIAAWQAVTGVILGLAGCYLITTATRLGLLALQYRSISRLADGAEIPLGELERLVDAGDLVIAVDSAVFLCGLATVALWFMVTGRAIDRYQGDRRTIRRHWTYLPWRIGAVFTALLAAGQIRQVPLGEDGRPILALLLSAERHAILVAALCFPVVGLFAGWVLVVRRRIETLAADPTLYPSTGTDQPGTPMAARGRLADAAFWPEVGARVARATGPLPLLEYEPATFGVGGRWHLLTGAAAVDAVRSAVRPGARLTVYDRPLRPVDERVLEELAGRARQLLADPASGGAVGLIEEPGTGAVRSERLVLASVAAFITRAAAGARVGLYPVRADHDPGTLATAVPAGASSSSGRARRR